MLLNASKKIQVLLGGAPATTQPVLSASWLDIDADGNGTTGSNESNANGTTPVDLIPAPTFARQVKSIHIYNADTAAVVVTVRRNVSATTYNICKVTLAAGNLLSYAYEEGWKVIDGNGGLVGSSSLTLTGDVTGTGTGTITTTLATAQPAVHTWALTQTFTVAPVFTDAPNSRAALGVAYGTTGSTVCVGNDSRLSDARTPVGTALTSANVWVGSAGNLAAAVAVSGDVTISNAGVTAIGAGKVTLAMQANMATASVVYRKTAGSGAPEVNTLATLLTDLQGDGLTSKQAGFRNLPQNSQSANYTTVAADAGADIYHPSADTTARTWTIDSNANVPYPIGTVITMTNGHGAGTLTVTVTADTIRKANSGTTANVTVLADNWVTFKKSTATEWLWSGTAGVT